MNTRQRIIIIGLGLLFSAIGKASDQIPARKQDHAIAIVGAAIHPVTGPPIANGSILFENGSIVAVGQNVVPPEGTEIIDATGKHVYPGLFSGNTDIGLVEIGAVRATRDVSETGQINPNVRAQAAFNPETEIIPVTRANGITMFVTAPAGGLISGTSAVMLADGWTWEDMTYKAPAALVVNWPRMTLSHAPWVRQSDEEQKKAREKSLQELDTAFRDARAYMLARRSDQANGTSVHTIDTRWEAMIPVLERKIPILVWATEIQEIEAAVAWAGNEQVNIIIGGGDDAWRVTDLLKKNDIPVLVGGIHRLPGRRFEEYDEPFHLPARLYNAGIRFAITSADAGAHERNLPYQAATAAAYGLPKDEALKAVTLYPARMFGVDDRVGSLETGKDATLIVTTGDPLEIMTQVEMEFIQGRRIDLTSKHTMLYDKYREKYRRLDSGQ